MPNARLRTPSGIITLSDDQQAGLDDLASRLDHLDRRLERERQGSRLPSAGSLTRAVYEYARQVDRWFPLREAAAAVGSTNPQVSTRLHDLVNRGLLQVDKDPTTGHNLYRA